MKPPHPSFGEREIVNAGTVQAKRPLLCLPYSYLVADSVAVCSSMRFVSAGFLAILSASVTEFAAAFVVRHRRHERQLVMTDQRCFSSVIQKASNQEEDEPDLFEYFDPLLSPHAYPNGISPDEKPLDPKAAAPRPLPKIGNPVGFNLNGSTTKRTTSESATKLDREKNFRETEAFKDRPAVDTSVVFDPTISPHAYANGTPDVVVGDEGTVYIESSSNTISATTTTRNSRKLGVLLIDHGSRKESSNKRLHALAERYQETVADSNTIVTAAHMEIATPSIADGIVSLLEAGVDEIICHPYFLSPGRHVQEDIPQIVQAAIDDLKTEIPIVTTPPTGSNTDLMITAMNGLVQEASASLKRT